MVTTWAISKTRETDEFMIVTRTAEIYLKWSPIQLLLLHSQPLRNFHSLQSLSDSSKFSKNISESFIIIWQSPLPDLLMKLNGENETTLDIPLTAEDLTFSSFRVECSHQIYNLAESLQIGVQYKSWKRNLRCPTEDSTFRCSVTTEMEINILENRSISREQERTTFRSSIAASAFPALPPTPWNLPPKWE